jgi:L-alanine-DL-glutamate epimerase-like enolase superfamily enzyme
MWARVTIRTPSGRTLRSPPVRIVGLTAHPIRVPLRFPVAMSNVVLTATRNVLVRLVADDGTVGWGEAVEGPFMTGETPDRILAAVRELSDVVVGADPRDRAGLWRTMAARLHGNATARGAIDVAVHDLVGRSLGVSVATLLGAPAGQTRDVMTLLGSADTDADLATFRARRAEGFRWFKLKLGVGDVEVEAATVRAIAEELGDDVLCADVNAGWDLTTTSRFLHRVADLPLRFLEQPVDDRATLVRIAERSPIAICADEHADSFEAIAAFGPSAVAGISLKNIKLGGITGILRGATLAAGHGMSLNLAGKTAETSIGAAANLHAAAAIGDLDFGLSPGNLSIARDITRDPIRIVGGTMRVPDGPGLGIEVDEALVAELADPDTGR